MLFSKEVDSNLIYAFMIKISSLSLLKEASPLFHLQEGSFLVLPNKISQLWFMFCLYHFANFVQKHNYYLNYPNQTIHFFYWLVLCGSFIFNGFPSHFRCFYDFFFFLLLVAPDLQVAPWPLAVQMVFLLHITILLNIFSSLEGWHKAINNYWLNHHSLLTWKSKLFWGCCHSSQWAYVI